jgi:hypothetical protein
MNRLTSALLIGLAALPFLTLRLSSQDAAAKVRVGTYDNRAIAVAYTSSKYNNVSELMRDHEEAKRAGDKKRALELEEQGAKRQRQLHRQGFGRVPVDDLLAPVADKLPAMARDAGVDLIAWHCNWTGPGVEVVDVTDALVRLYEPSEKALGWIADLRKQAPLDLDEIEKSHEH